MGGAGEIETKVLLGGAQRVRTACMRAMLGGDHGKCFLRGAQRTLRKSSTNLLEDVSIECLLHDLILVIKQLNFLSLEQHPSPLSILHCQTIIVKRFPSQRFRLIRHTLLCSPTLEVIRAATDR